MTNQSPTLVIPDLPEVEVTAPAAPPPSSPSVPPQATTAPYAKRAINITFQLGQGSFGQSGSNQITLTGLRVYVEIESVILPNPPNAVVRIFGMTLSQINQLSQAGLVWQTRGQNLIAVQAGDVGGQMTTVFNGLAFEAYPDFNAQPNVSFVIMANSGAQIQLQPQKPISFNGATSVDTALTRITGNLGIGLENNGVNTTLSYPYFPGAGMQQIMSVLKAADCFGTMDYARNVLAIWPKTGSRSTGGVPTISPNTGMIGYPTFQKNVMTVRTVFDPSLHGPADQAPGQKVNVQSQLQAANGQWTIRKVSYRLMSEMPNGPWEMILETYPAANSGANTSSPTPA